MKYKRLKRRFKPKKFKTQTGIKDKNPNKTALMKVMDNGLTIQALGQVLKEGGVAPFVYIPVKLKQRAGLKTRPFFEEFVPLELKTWKIAEQLAKKNKGKYGGPADYWLKLYLGQLGFTMSRALSPMDLVTDYQKGTGTDLGPIMGLVTGDFSEAGIEDMLTAKKKSQIKKRRMKRRRRY